MNVLKLKGKRTENGLTQEELAEKTGISSISYCRKENGTREFNCSEISKIIIALRLNEREVMEIFFN